MERSKNEALMDHRERAKEHKSASETEEENEPQLERKEVDSRVKTDSRKFHMERSINEDYPGDDERHVGIGEKKPSTARRPQSSGYLSNSDESYHGSSKNKLRDRRIGQRSFDESNSRSGKGNKLPSSSENESDSDNTTLRAVRRPGDKAYVKEDDVQRSTKNTFSMREGNSDSDYRHFSEEKDKESDKRTVQHVDHDGEKEYNVSRESRHKEKMLQGRQISIEKSNRIEYDSGESIVEEKRSYHFKSSTKKNNNRSESSEDEQYKRNAPVRSEVNRDSNRRKANTLNLRNNESDSESDDSLPRRNKKNDSDSDRYHLKETKYRDEERNYSSRKSSGKFVVEGKIRYKESKEEQLSESNDTGSFKTGKSKFNEDQYEEHAPRRRKDMTSKKSPKYRSDSFELLHSKHDPLQKSKYQLSSDEGESYARRFHNQMVDIDANSRQRKEIESPSHHYKEEPCEDKNIMEGHLSTDFKGKLHINRGDRYHKELVDSDVNYGRGKKSLSTEERNSDWNRKKMGDYSSRNIQEKYYSNKEDRYQEMADTDVYYGRRKKELQSNEYEEEKPDCRSRNLQNNYVDREDRDQEEMMDIDQSSSRMKKMESSFGHFKELNDKDRNRRSSIEPGYEYEMYGSGRRRQHRSSEKERNTVSEWTKGDNYREPYSSGEQFIEHDFDRSMQHFDENQGYGYNLSSDIQRKVPEIDWENQKASHARKRDDEPPLEYLESYGKNSNPKASDGPLVRHDGHYTQAGRRHSHKENGKQTRHRGPGEDTQYQNPSVVHRKSSRENYYYTDEHYHHETSSNHYGGGMDHDYVWSKQTYNAARYHDKPDRRERRRLTAVALISKLLKEDQFQLPTISLGKSGLNPRDVKAVVDENLHLFSVSDGVQEMVCLHPQIKICTEHVHRGCGKRSSCRELHICPRYIQAKCRYPSCVLGHNLLTKRNANVLEDFCLSEVPESELLEVLRHTLFSNKASQHLKVCHDYNNNSCRRVDCSYLHICIDYITHMQCGRSNCNLDHSVLSRHNRQVLENLGIDTNESPRDVIKVIKEKYPYLVKHLPLASSGSRPKRQEVRQQAVESEMQQSRRPQSHNRSHVSEYNDPHTETRENRSRMVDRENYQSGASGGQSQSIWCDYYQGNTELPEICYYSVKGQCKYEEEGCRRLHSDRHFHWQVKQKSKGWVNLRSLQVEALERSYCSPDQDGVTLPLVDPRSCPKEIRNLFGDDTWQAHFSAMLLKNATTGLALDLRRICSENIDGSVKCAFNAWYFLDQNGVWVKYGNTDTTKRDFLASNVTSQHIENQFKMNPKGSMIFKNSMFSYLLDFKTMTQTNTSTNVARKVKRRPEPHLKAKSWSATISNFLHLS